MNRITMFASAIAAFAALADVGAARAQQADSGRFTVPANPRQPLTAAPEASFRVLGAPLGIDAPVAPPYANSAYRNFAGQPATGNSTLSAASGLTD